VCSSDRTSAAVEARIPCLTSLDTAAALVRSLEHTAVRDLHVRPLTDYVSAAPSDRSR